ncbi:MAG: DUF2459 domain-containing protein [Verrucomicrobiota bacterium]|nr:DUF2459 domain-containing protein [Verrucomicrobiota bacterium]
MAHLLDPAGRQVRSILRLVPLVLAFLLAAGCAGPSRSLYPPRAGETQRSVFVINHGALHTGLAVKRSDIPVGVWPASRDYARSKYLEVGWGDDDGYRKPLTSSIAIKALAGSKRTVLLSDGFNVLNEKVKTTRFTVIEVDLSDQGFARLCQHIEQTYALDGSNHPIRLGQGGYRARGTYSAFHTCNTWVAQGLRQAGCPISPAYCLTPGPLLSQVRRFGRVLKSPKSTRSRRVPST